MDLKNIIDTLGLQPHPEGGHFAEIWRADEGIAAADLPDRYGGDRSFGTAIYYLLGPHDVSAMHRITSDEIFHFYLGDPVEQLHLMPDGSHAVVEIGPDLAAGQRPQVIVPRGVWQGARVKPGGRFALMGTTVAPGFDFADFEMADAKNLSARWPDAAEMIAALS
ncbi:MAG: cupin domain-containing protein [Minwuia sp.]|uniref:cupin domain-containing protein n=1 Tax=Minwuia sp. TaxID=2493630 RepID=UPI003A8737F5